MPAMQSGQVMPLGAQTTLAGRVELAGKGVHSGRPARLVLHPAVAGSGIRFLRADLKDSPPIQATWKNVTDTSLCTVIGQGENRVATVEHLMAALYALGVDNVLVEVNGSEVPVLDGSSRGFVEAIEAVGLKSLSRPRRAIRILEPLAIEVGESRAELRPANTFLLDVTIDFDHALIGRQRYQGRITPAGFRRELAAARTFGFRHQVEALNARGLALGSSLENSIGIDGDSLMNPEGLRFQDEFVRHKALDAVGDIAMCGLPLMGAYVSYKCGHRVNFEMVKALFANPDRWCIVSDEERAGVAALAAQRAASVFDVGSQPVPVFHASKA